MANSLQVAMASCSFPLSFPTFSSKRAFRPCCRAKIPMPPLNPKDPFIKKLTSLAANSPEMLQNRPFNSDKPPYLDLYDLPTLMATPSQLERSVSYNEHRPRTPPPDLPSILLHGRIVYIAMPLVPAVTELVIAQLMYLQWMDDKETIYFYINSTGTARDDGEQVALEANGLAIYDSMMHVKNEIHTVNMGVAVGQACLLLAAGTKGKRYMLPNSRAVIQQPKVPSYGLLRASDVQIHANEAVIGRNTFAELLAKHTGNSAETVTKAMRRTFTMDCIQAKEFGVIDKVLWQGQQKMMSEVAKPEDWDRGAGIRVVDGF